MKIADLASLSDDEWFGMLLRSVNSRIVDGVEFPAFPAPDLQAAFVGSSNESALHEGMEFYKQVRNSVTNLRGAVHPATDRFLDFGCGWGRYLRIFRKDFDPANMYGVDVDPTVLDSCSECGVPGQLQVIEPSGFLAYPEGFFDQVVAYSVFTHLPERVHLHWVREISRVMKPGGVFALTLQPARFLEHIEELAHSEPKGPWDANLRRFSRQAQDFKNDFDDGRFVYVPTGGGDYRSADVYGEAVVPLAWVRRHWADHFEVVEYIDDIRRFSQAVLVARKPD